MSLCQEDVLRGLLSDRAKLLAYIRAIVLSVHAAEDIHQDVVVLAIQKADTIQDERHLLLWARRVAKRKAIDYLRRQGRQPQHLDLDVLELMEPNWEMVWQTESPSMMGALHDCLQELSPHARTIVGLRFTNRLSCSEISKRLNVKLQSIYTALSRIYRALSLCVESKQGNAE